MNFDQLCQQYPDIQKQNNWRLLKPKAYKAFIARVPASLTPQQLFVVNESLGVRLNVKPGNMLLCRPYLDIRVVPAEFIECCTIKEQTGMAALQTALKKVQYNGVTEVVLPWTPVIVNNQRTDLMAIRIDYSKYKNIDVSSRATNAPYELPGITQLIANSTTKNNHGYGDYIVAKAVQLANGQYAPILSHGIDVINGKTFCCMYNMQSFAGYDIPEEADAYEKPAELCNYKSLNIVKKTGKEIVDEVARKNGLIVTYVGNAAEYLADVSVNTASDSIPETKPEKSTDWPAVRKPSTVFLSKPNSANKIKLIITDAWTLANLYNDRIYSMTLISATDAKTQVQKQPMSLASFATKL